MLIKSHSDHFFYFRHRSRDHAVAVWEMYQSQLKATGEEISQARYNVRRAKWAVNEKPYFLAANFIATANVLKNNRIKLPCDSIMQSDPTKYPPVPIANKKQGRRRVRRMVAGTTRCRICQQPGHSRRTPKKKTFVGLLVTTVKRVITTRVGSIGITPLILHSKMPFKTAVDAMMPLRASIGRF